VKMAIAANSKKSPARDDSLRIAFLSSVGLHICVLLIGSLMFHSNAMRPQQLLSIALVDLPSPEDPPRKEVEATPEIKRPPLPPKVERPKDTKGVVKNETKPAAQVEVAKREPPPLPAPAKEEPAKATEANSFPPAQETPPSLSSAARVEGGGSEAGTGNLYGGGDAAVISGNGTATGGGGTAVSGLGRGSGAPGLPGLGAPLRTNRQAKPIETVKASYPPMALRAGLESDVTLRIEVDAQGKVTKAEITRSGGAGFDEEALKAVRQSRFEPAQNGVQNVAAEFTYIYRFRLRR
jgi:protein TonB